MVSPAAGRSVLVTGTSLVPDEALSLIEERGFGIRRVHQDYFTDDALHAALDGVSGYLIGGYEEPSTAHFEVAKTLEAVAWIGTDYQGYVPGWERAFELGIAFVSCPGVNAVSVAEFTVLLMLALARSFVGRVQTAKSPATGPAAPGVELRGRTLGVVGAGRIGARVARIVSDGFGMNAVYHAPRRNHALEHATSLTQVGMAELLDCSDVISLHRPGPAPGEPRTLGYGEFERMRPGALLVNTGHRDLVDPDALLWAARTKGVRAAFDGVGDGPGWQPLLSLGPDRFLCVPQMGFHTVDANLRGALLAARSVCDVLAGVESASVNNSINNPDFRAVRRSVGRSLAYP